MRYEHRKKITNHLDVGFQVLPCKIGPVTPGHGIRKKMGL